MRSNLRLAVIGGLLLATLAISSKAHAGLLIAGNSDGSFFFDCNGGGCPAGQFSSLTLGSTASGGSGSTLSIANTAFSASQNISGLALADLHLSVGNKPGAAEGAISFDYDLELSFSTPVGLSSEILNLAIQGNAEPGSNGEVTVSGLTIGTLPTIMLPGVTLFDFQFVDSGSNGVLSNGVWTVSGNAKEADLILVADVVDPPLAIPEPTSLVLLGSALIGFAALKASIGTRQRPAEESRL